MNNMQQMFFTILNAHLGLGKRPERYELSESEWEALFKFSNTHELCSMIYVELTTHKNNIPLQLKTRWALQNVQLKQRTSAQLSALFRLRDILNERSIQIVLLKGQSYASLYPQPELRQSNDVDFYTIGHFDEVNDLLADLGAEVTHKDKKHSEIEWHGVEFENHFRMNNDGMNKPQQVIGKYISRGFDSNHTVDSRLPGILIPDINIAALHMFIHMLSHLSHQNVTLRQITDWVMYVRRYGDQLDWNFLDMVWREAGIMRIVGIINKFCHAHYDWYEVPLDYNDSFTAEEYDYVAHDILNPTLIILEYSSVWQELSTMLHDYRRRKKMYEIVYGVSYDSGYYQDISLIWRTKKWLRRLYKKILS